MAERRSATDIIKSYGDGDTTTVVNGDRKSGAEAIIKRYDDADATTAASTPDDPYSLKHAWIQIPALHNFAAGVTRGVTNIGKTAVDAASWVDKRVPALNWLDQHTIGDLAPLQTRMEEGRQQFEASPEGQSIAGKVGTVVGEVAGTLPLAGPVGEAAALGTNALLRAAPSVVRWLGSTAAAGGAGGATYGALTAGGSEKPAGKYIGENALIGAVAGPPLSALAAGAGATARGVRGAYKYYTGTGPADVADAAIDAARARAAAGSPTPAPAAKATPVEPPATPVEPPGGAAGADITSPSALAANAPDRAREIAGKVAALDDMIAMRPNVGVADFHPHVRGNLPTQAEGLGDAELASIQRQVEPGNQRFTNYREGLKENRHTHYDERAGTAEQLDTLEKEIAAWDEKTLGPVWARKSPVDASGVAADVRARLASPDAQIGPVEQALKEVEQRLFKRGTEELHTDPQMLYGARRHISYLLSRKGQLANPQYGDDDVMRHLIGVRDEIDRAIEPGAEGFKQWVTEHATKMRDVDRMTLLQAIKPKLIGNGEIQGSRLLTQIKALRTMMARDGANPAHSLTIEDLEMIRDLHRDLLREGNKALSIPVGSPTSHNREVAAEHGLSVVNSLLQHGASKVPFAGEALSAFNAQMAAKNALRAKEAWTNRLLAQPPSGP